MNKYRNKKVQTPDGIFDSKKEYKEWCELKMLQHAGRISHLERQKVIDLIPTIRTSCETLRKTTYKADFYYFDEDEKVWTIQDTKGFVTSEYSLKKRLVLFLYPDVKFIESGKNKKVYIIKK